MLKQWLINKLKKLGLLLAILIIIMAMVTSLIRMATPLLNRYHHDFESWASDILHMPVKIQKVRVGWYYYQPVITFVQATILNNESKQPILQIQKVRVIFSIPASIWHRQPILSAFQVSGTKLNIFQNAKDELSMRGFPVLARETPQTAYEKETQFSAVLGWLVKAEHLILHDIDVHYVGKSKKERHFTLYDLNVLNQNAKHHIYGKAILHQELPTKVQITIDWQGDSQNLATISGDVYLNIAGLSVAQWLKDMSWHDWRLQSGLARAKVWLSWQAGKLQRWQTNVQAYDLGLYQQIQKKPLKIARLSGQFGWRQLADHAEVAGKDVLIDWPNRLWPTNHFLFSYQMLANGQFQPRQLNIGILDLQEIDNLLPYASNILATDTITRITRVLKAGYLQDFNLTFPANNQDWQQSKVSTHFNYLYTDAYDKLPAIENLSGAIKWDGKAGEISLMSEDTNFSAADYFPQSLTLKALTGKILISRNNLKQWLLSTEMLTLKNDEIEANLAGNILIPRDLLPIVDLKAQCKVGNMARLSAYLPTKLFAPDLQSWLQQAFNAGEVPEANIEVHGALANFPFDQKPGAFTVLAKVKDAELHYAPGWPRLKAMNGTVNFHNRSMQVALDSASLQGLTINDITANIPYLGSEKQAKLVLHAKPFTLDLERGLQFIKQSPLQATLGKTFAYLVPRGQGQFQLQLTIPLLKPESTQVLASINLQKARVDLPNANLQITDVDGALQFTEQSIKGDKITGKIFSEPVTINVKSTNKKGLHIESKFLTSINIPTFAKWLKAPITNLVSGKTSLQGRVNFTPDQPLTIDLTSDLVGVKVDLPLHLDKLAPVASRFAAHIILDEQAPLKMQLAYGKLVKAALTFSDKSDDLALESCVLNLGQGEAAWSKEPGLYITGSVDKIDWQTIQPLVNAPPSNSTMLPTLKNIDMEFGQVTIGSFNLNDVDLSLTPKNQHWYVDIDADELAGQMVIPFSLTKDQEININLSRLKINTDKTGQALASKFSVKSLPAIQFTTDELIFNDKSIGKVKLLTEPNRTGLAIQELQISSARMNLEADGTWVQQGDQQYTDLQGKVNSKQLNELLRSFKIDIHNFIANQGSLNFDLSWQGAPYEADLGNLNGDVSLNIGKGRIIDVGKETDAKMGIGRMLSLFSFQTIPRRLSLDFSDLFQKGYSFDSIKGNYHFFKGDALTQDMRIDGPVAKVKISGRIGFVAKDFDLNLKVTPYVTESIPVAAAVITGQPLIGVAAWAVNKVIGSQVSKVTTYVYHVAGPWDNPRWESVSSLALLGRH